MTQLTADKFAWYLRYRRAGETPKHALYSAKIHADATREAQVTLGKLSPSSRARIEAFVHDFIRCDDLAALTSERDSDYINEPERASRCAGAGEGCDGKTHADVIGDWRDYFVNWLREHKVSGNWGQDPNRFTGAVEADFTLTEMFHEFAGTLHQEIG